MERVFGRKISFDPRSKNYPVIKRIGERRSTLWDCKKHLDQGKEGSCVGFGCGHELVADPVECLEVDYNYCREAIYWAAQKIDDWPGGDYPGAFPRYEGTSVLAGLKTLKASGWCDEYRWAFGLNDVLDGIANGPFIMGTNWYQGMNNTDTNGFIHVSGANQGGHCWLLKGINFEDSYATGHNSWSTNWGVLGDFKISLYDLDKLLVNNGEAAQLVGRKIVPAVIEPSKTFWQALWEIIKSIFGGK